MIGEPPLSGEDLVQAVFSDDPLPDVPAAIVVAHPGDETLGASWSLARLHDRASVFCLRTRDDGDIDAAVLEQRVEAPMSLPAAEFRAHARATDAFSRAGLIPQLRL